AGKADKTELASANRTERTTESKKAARDKVAGNKLESTRRPANAASVILRPSPVPSHRKPYREQPEAASLTWGTQFRDRRRQMGTWRDSLAAIPAIPTPVWVGGIGFVLLTAGIRVVRTRRALSKATPAPADVMEYVRDSAAHVGLKRQPRAMVID